MKKKMLMVVAWLAVTAGSVVIATAAVTTAGSAVSDDSVQAVALRDVLTTLAQDAGGSTVTSPTTSMDTPVVTSSPQQATVTSPSSPSTTTSVPTTVATTVASVTTTQPTAATPKTYRVGGGTVVVSVDEGARTVVLLGATSAAGFDVDVEDDGPDEVRVEFTSSSFESKIRIKFEGGVLDVRVEEEPKDGGDD